MKKTIPIIIQSLAAGIFLVSHFILPGDSEFSTISDRYNLYLAIILFIVAANILYFTVIDNNKILKKLDVNSPNIYKYQNGQLLLIELYKRLEKNGNQIAAIYSTAIQSKIDILNEYNSYSENLYNVFKRLDNKPKLRFFYQIPIDINSNTATEVLNYFYNISFGPLYEKYSNYYNSNNDDMDCPLPTGQKISYNY